MKDWKAAVRTWEKNDFQIEKKNGSNKNSRGADSSNETKSAGIKSISFG